MTAILRGWRSGRSGSGQRREVSGAERIYQVVDRMRAVALRAACQPRRQPYRYLNFTLAGLTVQPRRGAEIRPVPTFSLIVTVLGWPVLTLAGIGVLAVNSSVLASH